MKIIVTGGTGFVGKALVSELVKRGHHVSLFTRHAEHFKSLPAHGLEIVAWDGSSQGGWIKSLEQADAVIHLAGEPLIGKRWNALQKQKLVTSRVDSTRLLVNAIRKLPQKPAVLINASAVGFYGSVSESEVTENSPKGEGFLADLCAQWEKEALEAQNVGLRVVCVRIGVVLEKNGGALSKMLLPFQFFLGGPLGSGKQAFPWVHREDVVGIILFALENPAVKGPINAVAPEALTMKEFCTILGKTMKRPSWAPVPAFALKLLLGEVSEMLLTGQRVVPEKAKKLGFSFHYSKAEEALQAILKK